MKARKSVKTLFLLLVLIITVGGYFGYQKYQLSKIDQDFVDDAKATLSEYLQINDDSAIKLSDYGKASGLPDHLFLQVSARIDLRV